MPELPEVETMIKGLRGLEGDRIEKIEVIDDKLKGIERLKGKTICKIYRRGKYITFDFNPFSLVAHLGMTGRFSFYRGSHTRAIFKFRDKSLYFIDIRRFGSLKIFQKPLPLLGLEPLDREFNTENLLKELGRSRRRIKEFLMDQQRIAGIGNIYANEVLFRSGIHPQTRADTLSKKEVNTLIRTTRDILKRAIKEGGTTIRDYKDPEGREGRFQDFLMVYGREGKPCKICGSPIRRILQGGRSTYLCEVCQRLERG